MEFSKRTLSIVRSIVDNEATFDRDDQFFNLYVSKISDIDLSELCSSIMSDDPDLAIEATGPDNINFDKSMLPALLNHLKNTSDKDEMYFFLSTYQRGIVSYLTPTINVLLEDALDELNKNYSESRIDAAYSRVNMEEENRIWAA